WSGCRRRTHLKKGGGKGHTNWRFDRISSKRSLGWSLHRFVHFAQIPSEGVRCTGRPLVSGGSISRSWRTFQRTTSRHRLKLLLWAAIMFANGVYENRQMFGKTGEFMELDDTKRRINSRSKQNLLIVPAPSACEWHLTIYT